MSLTLTSSGALQMDLGSLWLTTDVKAWGVSNKAVILRHQFLYIYSLDVYIPRVNSYDLTNEEPSYIQTWFFPAGSEEQSGSTSYSEDKHLTAATYWY